MSAGVAKVRVPVPRVATGTQECTINSELSTPTKGFVQPSLSPCNLSWAYCTRRLPRTYIHVHVATRTLQKGIRTRSTPQIRVK